MTLFGYHLFVRRSISDAASELGKRGAAIRESKRRELINAKARQLCAEMGQPVPPALLP